MTPSEYRTTRPDKFDECPSCGNPKRKHGKLCRKCRCLFRDPIEQPADPFIRHISLTRGQVAVVDTHLYDWLVGLCGWQAQWNEKTRSYYAVGYVNRKATSMHRLILGLEPKDPRHGDHESSGDTLNNRGINLRIAGWAKNAKNRRINQNNTTGYKGVHRNGNSYIAQIRVDGKRMYLGRRSTAEAAWRELYVPAALEYHGEFARLE